MDQLLHINYGRNEVCTADHRIDPGIHAEKRADTVGDQGDVLKFSFQLCYRLPDFLPGFPWRKGLIIQTNDLTFWKQRPVVFTLPGAASLAVDIQHQFLHYRFLKSLISFCRFSGNLSA